MKNRVKKYKLLRIGRYYINKDGSFVIGVLTRDTKYDYRFLCSHANAKLSSGIVRMLTRVVLNDGNYTEIDFDTFRTIVATHANGITNVRYVRYNARTERQPTQTP